MTCQWFALCEHEATKQVEHPTLGWVDICDDHLAWLGERPSPTQFVPPLAAAVMSRRATVSFEVVGVYPTEQRQSSAAERDEPS
jgi:hypothetical protein